MRSKYYNAVMQIGVALANGPIWNAFHIWPVAIATPKRINE
jgi:hypothetical protein